MNATISEADKNQIKQYLLGQLAETDEEQVELRLMSDRAFSEEFDIVVDEMATLYVSRHFKGDEKTQVEQYFLRSPERRTKVQFICEMLRQINVPVAQPVQQNIWQRMTAVWGQPSVFRPAISFAILLIVAGLVFWVISNNAKPTYQSLELAMGSSERSVGTAVKRVHLESGTDGLLIKLKLPGPTVSQYRASLRGEPLAAPTQLTIEAQDAESITVLVPADQLSRGSYAIELTEINNGRETPLRDAYEFTVD
jgi:hypothetical protein